MTERKPNDSPEPRKVKVTDKRRVRPDGAASSRGGSSGTRSGAPDSARLDGQKQPSSPAEPDATLRSQSRPGGDAKASAASDTSGSPEPADSVVDAPIEAGSVGSDQARAAEYLDDLRRLKAEFDNYRKRVLKEQTRVLEAATEPLVGRLLEVLDEFELAIMHAGGTPETAPVLKGVEMIYAKLAEVLKGEGLERIEALDQPFDPERHEALLQGEGDEGEAYVADVLRPGYTLRGRVVRPAGVKVDRR